MAVNTKWPYKNVQDVRDAICAEGLSMRLPDSLSALKQTYTAGTRIVPNRMVIHPMEGNDSEPNGAPGEKAYARYKRYAESGAGTIWFEAISCVEEGRSCPAQMWINRDSLDEFRKLVDMTRELHVKAFGNEPLLVAQLTHSGRFSRPNGVREPLFAGHEPYSETAADYCQGIDPVSDDYLEQLEDRFAEAALLLEKAGFQAIDLKACHRYLVSELLGSFQRPGRYGGSFENRTRFLRNIVGKTRENVGKDIILSTRINIYDHVPYPYGFGVSAEKLLKPDYFEPIWLLKQLYEEGIRIASLSMGNGHYWPLTAVPAGVLEGYEPLSPLKNMQRFMDGIEAVTKAIPDLVTIGAGYGWLKEYAPYAAAGAIEDGKVTAAGFGRMSYAYPEMYRDILEDRPVLAEKACMTCGACSAMLEAGCPTGCVIRNPAYRPIYRKMKEEMKA